MTYLNEKTVARLIITCPDQPGIVSKVTQFLYHHHANITTLDQHSTDPENGMFFMRVEFQTPNLDVPKERLAEQFSQNVATSLGMNFRFHYATPLKRMALLVSKHDHVMVDLLWRLARKELPLEVPFVISNHLDLKEAVEHFQIPFIHIPNNSSNRVAAEKEMLLKLKGAVDGIVLARYMQILSKDFVAHFPNKIINIHHSFLPAFVGADPYLQAYQKGVKLIGATAHYVTHDLDMGPIIEQDVSRVTHRMEAKHLKEMGKEVEQKVLARALKWHLEDRVLVHDNKTIVFL